MKIIESISFPFYQPVITWPVQSKAENAQVATRQNSSGGHPEVTARVTKAGVIMVIEFQHREMRTFFCVGPEERGTTYFCCQVQ